jgi:hypothetical protein
MVQLFMKLNVKIIGLFAKKFLTRIHFETQFLQVLNANRNFTFQVVLMTMQKTVRTPDPRRTILLQTHVQNSIPLMALKGALVR